MPDNDPDSPLVPLPHLRDAIQTTDDKRGGFPAASLHRLHSGMFPKMLRRLFMQPHLLYALWQDALAFEQSRRKESASPPPPPANQE